MIMAAFPVGNGFRTGFENTVGDDGKTHPSVSQVGVPNAHSLFNGCGVVRIGKLSALGAVYHVHHFNRLHKTACIGTAGPARFWNSSLTPKVSVKNIVIVGYADGWCISH